MLPLPLFPVYSQLRDERFTGHAEPRRGGLGESCRAVKNRVMIRSATAALVALFTILVMPASAEAHQAHHAHGHLQCVAYARSVSAVQLSGNARNWWDNAEGVYDRGQQPVAGAVLAFGASHAMPMGHVATVAKVIDGRHILLNHANWSRPGMVEHDAWAVDVSVAGDWSSVRVWYAPTRSLGQREVSAHGFIYPAHTSPAHAELANNALPAKAAA